MALLKNICQNLNKKLSDIELAHEFKSHGLYSQYLKSEGMDQTNRPQCTSVVTLNTVQPVSTIGAKYHELKIRDTIYFQRWWNTVRMRKHSPRQHDVIEMMGVIESNEYLLTKLKKLFGEYDHFMKMYRTLEALIQKQFFLIVCLHSTVVLVTIHIFTEIYLEWGEFLDEKNLQLAKVNFTVHLVQIVHDFGCLALAAIVGRNEVGNRVQMFLFSYFFHMVEEKKRISKIERNFSDKKHEKYCYKTDGYAILR